MTLQGPDNVAGSTGSRPNEDASSAKSGIRDTSITGESKKLTGDTSKIYHIISIQRTISIIQFKST